MSEHYSPVSNLRNMLAEWARADFAGFVQAWSGYHENERQIDATWHDVYNEIKQCGFRTSCLALAFTPITLPIVVIELGIASLMQGICSISKMEQDIKENNTTRALARGFAAVSSIGASVGMMKTGMMAGAALGTIVNPGIGTAIGAVVGFLMTFGPANYLFQKVADALTRKAPTGKQVRQK